MRWYEYMTQGSVHRCRGRITEWIITAERTANGWKWSREPSPLVNCAKIGLGYSVGAINGLALQGVCMINFSLFSKTSWFPVKKKKRAQPIKTAHGDVTGLGWRSDWLKCGGPGRGRGQALHFYIRVCSRWTVWSWSTPLHGPLGGAWPHLSSNDESCAGVAVRRRETAPSKRGDGDRGREGAAQRHDHGKRIQT